MFEAKYHLESNPTWVARGSTIVAIAGIALWAIALVTYLSFRMFMPADAEAAESISGSVESLLFLGGLLFWLSVMMYMSRWRHGKASVQDDKIDLIGDEGATISLSDVVDVAFLNGRNYGMKRLVQLRTRADKYEIKFKDEPAFLSFSSDLVKAGAKYTHIKIDATLLHPEL